MRRHITYRKDVERNNLCCHSTGFSSADGTSACQAVYGKRVHSITSLLVKGTCSKSIGSWCYNDGIFFFKLIYCNFQFPFLLFREILNFGCIQILTFCVPLPLPGPAPGPPGGAPEDSSCAPRAALSARHARELRVRGGSGGAARFSDYWAIVPNCMANCRVYLYRLAMLVSHSVRLFWMEWPDIGTLGSQSLPLWQVTCRGERVS